MAPSVAQGADLTLLVAQSERREDSFRRRYAAAMQDDPYRASDHLTVDSLVAIVGLEEFDAACKQAMSVVNESIASEVPHDLADRLWFEGDESLNERLPVAVDLYWRMPCYANLMYWPYGDFDEPTRSRMWGAFRGFLADPRDAVAEPAAYRLWVDHFEDTTTVDRAWREVSGPQEPRRPRLARVVAASGPVPWTLKESLYEQLAAESGWDEPLLAGLYGSCIDIYGSLERKPALRILRRLEAPAESQAYTILTRALEDPRLPVTGGDRRSYVAELSKKL
jgi:hypothetical protein